MNASGSRRLLCGAIVAAAAAAFTLVAMAFVADESERGYLSTLGLVVFAVVISGGVVALALAFIAAQRSVAEAARLQELLAQSAHQLRTPTATLSMEVDAALADPRAGGDVVALAERLTDHIEAQRSLVDRLLTLARLGARREPVVAVELAGLLHDVRRVLGPLAASRDVALRIESAPGLDVITGRSVELRELMVILGENAIVHGGGDVCISVHRVGREARLDVADGGSGFAGSTTPGLHGGAGLGLELARRIVERHGGQIEFDDRSAEDRGDAPNVIVFLPRQGRLRSSNQR